MYRHLLVPVDGTDLSVQVIGHAVALARPLGARISFVHLGEVPAGEPPGRVLEWLAKAEAAARALGVPCSARPLPPGPGPVEALAQEARASGCDLVVLASDGRAEAGGPVFAPSTTAGLIAAGYPVLVSASGTPTAAARAIGLLRDEHRTLAAVMHAWLQALAAAREAGAAAEPALMRAIVRHLQAFAGTRHHPKEDELLFARLRARTPRLDAELDELQRQHGRDGQHVEALAAQVEALAAATGAARVAATRALEAAVAAYARFLWDHMGREEGVVLPAAQQHLLAEDWAAIDSAFTREAQTGADAALDEPALLAHILAPVQA